MRFSIIVPTYNRKQLLGGCIDSLLEQNYPKKDYEIVVVDDGSTDNTAQLVKSLMDRHGNIRYFKAKHTGQGAARNIGLRNARGEFIAFTDDDCVVEKKWLKKIEAAFKRSNADAVGGSIINPTNRYIAWAQYILNFSAWFPEGKERYVKDIPTANICYRQKVIETQSFPETPATRVYEDSLYNYRLCRNGKMILFCPHISVKHFTWDENYGTKKFFEIQNKAGLGFILGGYKVHEKTGHILAQFRLLNLLCPRLLMVILRCIKYRYFMRFLICLPMIFAGEFYKGVIIFSTNPKYDQNEKRYPVINEK